MNKREEILAEKLSRLALRLALPGVLGMLVVSLNGLVDAFFVSHLVGENAFAGVSFTLPLLTVNAAVTALLASGAASIYSRAIGAKDEFVLGQLFQQLLIVIILSVLLLMFLGFFGGRYLLSWFDIPAAQLPYAIDFYLVMVTGCFFFVFGLCTSALLRAEGQVGKAMRITGVAMVLNALINPVLIRFAGLGVKGSALASIIAMAVYCLLTCRHLARRDSPLRMTLSLKPDLFLIKDLLRTGLPTFYMQANGFFRQMMLFKLAVYSSVNPAQIVVFSGIYRLFSFLAIPVFGFLQALGPVVGINFGAGEVARALRAVTVFRNGALLLIGPIAVFCLLFPQLVLSVFLSPDLLSSSASNHFRTVTLVLLLMPFASSSIVFLQSTGQSKLAAKFTLRREVLIFLPVILSSVWLLGYPGIYLGLLLENVIYINVVYWRTKKVIRNMSGQSLRAAI